MGLLEKTSKEAMFLRDKGICQKCLKPHERLEWSHVKRRTRSLRIKFVLPNVLSMCWEDHQWWHNEPTEAGPWFAETWPDRLEYLDAMLIADRGMGTVTTDELLQILEELRDYVATVVDQRIVGEWHAAD